MKERDKIEMEISIAGERIGLTVPFNSQDAVRETEQRVSELFRKWSAKYPDRRPKEILARVAFQFARYYGELLDETRQAIRVADDLDDRLSRLLADSDDIMTDEPDDLSDVARTDYFTDF
ncbi:MAG: cell division protein ZapA [Bacteroides sp.]|nr:cell division protein ZapA [Bacteroides sp.]